LPRTVWSITQNSLGDLIVGTEDYKIRTFTRDTSRADKGEELKEYEQELQSRTTASDMAQFEKAPDVSMQAKMAGKTDGDIQVFKKNGVPSAYMWKLAEKKWEYVGEVVDPNAGAGSSGMAVAPKYYDGDALFPAGEYDHIFDVELGDNVMRKLPFNNGENAITAAEKFCVRESLGRANIDQIRNFITQHSQPYATR
jgi:phospholipase A-2-activating protein